MRPVPRLDGDGPPLVPSPDQARDLLRRELLDPAYQTRDVLRRVLDWLQRLLDGGDGGPGGLPGLVALVVLAAIVMALVLALAWLASRLRRDRRAPDSPALLGGDGAEDPRTVRARAEAALAAGRPEDAVVDGLRALALREARAGRIDDVASATASEVAERLRHAHPAEAEAVRAATEVFEAVLYGHRSATAEQARAVLALDDRLAARPGARR
ncbi:DUF4129 domain-containing protein [Nocardioides sp. TRM66260-LWL]|uniref:DUF4129 domain-containing protein n=1 Tax=Nocardioides sp. TRM66260-LWL TaxID=2874478 RepID=UPI001CC42E3D|nr:DUF4129 domain-containing protein [Nocardioides sp. TRM66260-LWL]MBZ5734529.1 DUF4129 domain-containing protein [Nocardioides sp. TRM66260-LWL]